MFAETGSITSDERPMARFEEPGNKNCTAKREEERSQLCNQQRMPRDQIMKHLMLLGVTLATMIASLATSAGAAKLPDIYWNASNPIFRIDNTDHIFDVNKKAHDHDQVDLVCPQVASPQQQQQQQQSSQANSSQPQLSPDERYIIYSVSKEEYDGCRLNGPNARVVAVCDQQLGKQARPPYTVTFRSFTPQPNGLEFKAGQDYYFITGLMGQWPTTIAQPAAQQAPTGTGSGPGQSAAEAAQWRRFSPCRDLNMKVIFKVCCKNNSSSSASGANLAAPSTRRSSSAAAANVITIRPSLAAPTSGSSASHQQAVKHQTGSGPLNDYLRAISAPQPATVLPIEVLSTEPSSSPPPAPLLQTTLAPEVADSSAASQSTAQDKLANDIPLNDIPPLVTLAAPQPRPFGSPQQQQRRPTTGSGFLAFDPRAAPELLLQNERYAPTPLPPALMRPATTSGTAGVPMHHAHHSHHSHHAQQQQQSGQLLMSQQSQSQQQQLRHRQTTSGSAQASVPNRWDFYPSWQQQQQPEVSTRLATVTVAPQTGASSSAAASSRSSMLSATAASLLLVPIGALAVLLLLGVLQRRHARSAVAAAAAASSTLGASPVSQSLMTQSSLVSGAGGSQLIGGAGSNLSSAGSSSSAGSGPSHSNNNGSGSGIIGSAASSHTSTHLYQQLHLPHQHHHHHHQQHQHQHHMHHHPMATTLTHATLLQNPTNHQLTHTLLLGHNR